MARYGLAPVFRGPCVRLPPNMGPERVLSVVDEEWWMQFEVWAPRAESVLLATRGGRLPMEADPLRAGWWTVSAEAVDGDRYGFVLDGGPVLPDPRSRRQPDGPDGESAVVDHAAYAWRNEWAGRGLPGAVLYELHIGTFTEEGTFDAAADASATWWTWASPMCR